MAGKVGFRRKDTQRAIDAEVREPSGSIGVTRANEWGLTEKQEGFARDVAKGSTLVGAYRANYDCSNMAESSCHTEASKLIDNPRVATRVKALVDAANEKHLIDVVRVRRHIMDRLLEESMDMESPASARISALGLLGKVDVIGIFKETKEAKREEDDPVVLKDKLRKALAELTGIAPPVKD